MDDFSCQGCMFFNDAVIPKDCIRPEGVEDCTAERRADGKYVIFVPAVEEAAE